MTAVTARAGDHGVELEGRLPTVAPPSADVFVDVELASPGDTRVHVEPGAVVVTRFLAEPSDAAVHHATAELDRTLSHIRMLLTLVERAGGANADTTSLAPDLPDAPLPVGNAVLDALGRRFRVVRATQPGWHTPDASQPTAGSVRPELWYQVLEQRGDWARVRSEAGEVVWTDARSLVPANVEGDEP